jgi:methyltransferase
MVIPYAYLGFLLLLALERGVELALSRGNAAWAFARGGVEVGRGHFAAMKLLHGAFLLACAAEVVWLERPFVPALGWPMLAVALGAQVLRYWAIASLGAHWNVRVIVVPGAPAVTAGPYRWLRHPNYLAVALEGFAVPLVHGAWWTALGFSLANAALLAVRIRCEERALAQHCDYRARLGALHRFRPGRRQRLRPGRAASEAR